MKLIVISGRSGSGKSVVLRTLEDLGYYCVDNLPVSMLPTLTHAVVSEYDQIAISIDVRNLPKDPKLLTEGLEFLPDDVELTIIYLDASDDVLIKRFSETRRLHPLSRNNISLSDAIIKEKELFGYVQDDAFKKEMKKKVDIN